MQCLTFSWLHSPAFSLDPWIPSITPYVMDLLHLSACPHLTHTMYILIYP